LRYKIIQNGPKKIIEEMKDFQKLNEMKDGEEFDIVGYVIMIDKQTYEQKGKRGEQSNVYIIKGDGESHEILMIQYNEMEDKILMLNIKENNFYEFKNLRYNKYYVEYKINISSTCDYTYLIDHKKIKKEKLIGYPNNVDEKLIKTVKEKLNYIIKGKKINQEKIQENILKKVYGNINLKEIVLTLKNTETFEIKIYNLIENNEIIENMKLYLFNTIGFYIDSGDDLKLIEFDIEKFKILFFQLETESIDWISEFKCEKMDLLEENCKNIETINLENQNIKNEINNLDNQDKNSDIILIKNEEILIGENIKIEEVKKNMNQNINEINNPNQNTNITEINNLDQNCEIKMEENIKIEEIKIKKEEEKEKIILFNKFINIIKHGEIKLILERLKIMFDTKLIKLLVDDKNKIINIELIHQEQSIRDLLDDFEFTQ
jgi:hypothetical protein